MMSNRFTRIGSLIFIIIACACLLAPLIRLRSTASRAQPFAYPSWSHPVGTDDVGHDVLSDILYGGRTSLLVGVIVGIITTTIGLMAGGLAGYFKTLDAPIMRTVDMMIIPRLPLMIFLSLFLKPSCGT